MLERRIRPGSAAALAISLTMVGVGIHGLAQDTGGGTTADLASSVDSETPTPASETEPAAPAASAASENGRSLSLLEAPAEPDDTPPPVRRSPAPIAYPTVTVKEGRERPARTRQDPPNRDDCYGYTSNSSTSVGNVVAETTAGERPLARGESFAGTAAEQVIGFRIPMDGVHIKIDYFSGIDGSYLSTHDVEVEVARSYDVDYCHEANVLVTDPTPDPMTDILTPDQPTSDPMMPGPVG